MSLSDIVVLRVTLTMLAGCQPSESEDNIFYINRESSDVPFSFSCWLNFSQSAGMVRRRNSSTVPVSRSRRYLVRWELTVAASSLLLWIYNLLVAHVGQDVWVGSHCLSISKASVNRMPSPVYDTYGSHSFESPSASVSSQLVGSSHAYKNLPFAPIYGKEVSILETTYKSVSCCD